MEHYLPEIFWHDRQGLLSVDFQRGSGIKDGHYKIVTTSMQKEVRIWEFVFEKVSREGERDALAVNFVANITGHQSAVNVARFSPSGDFLASADSGGTVFIWKLSLDLPPQTVVSDNVDDFPPNKENWVRLRAPLRHDSDVSAVCWSNDSLYLASVSNDESIVVQNVRTGSRLWTIRSFRRFPNGVVWDPRGKYVVTMSTDRRLDILDAAKGGRLRCFHSVDFDTKQVSEKLTLKGIYKLFHDDQLMSFMRGADFSPDGELLIAPCGHLEIQDSNVYGTYVFRRRDFDKDCPAAFLKSRKPTFRAACSPVIFELRSDVEGNALGLPYRVVWAVLTLDAIIFYDSQSHLPFSYIDGIHYNNLSDAAWSSDGKVLLVSSLEGYCSFIRFDLNHIGTVTKFSMFECPPSPVLKVPKKPPKRSLKVSAKTPETPNVSEQEVSLNTSLSKGAVKQRPKPVNLISKYFKKSPTSVASPINKEPDPDVACLDGLQPQDDLKPMAGKTDISLGPKPLKQKRRVQLESVPIIELD